MNIQQSGWTHLENGKSELVNTNKLVRFYSGCTGLKTGSTSLALFNLSATATRNEFSLITVVMKGPTSQQRFNDAIKLLDFGFANFLNKVAVKKDEVIEKIKIEKATIKEVEIIIENDVNILCSKGDDKNIRTEIVYDENISAPLEYREKIGVINCYLNEELMGTTNLLVNQAVKSKSIMDFLNELIIFSYRLR